MKKSSTLLQLIFAVFCLSALFFSCEDDSSTMPEENKTEDENTVDEGEDQDGVGGNVMKFQGEIFSIPSPIQSAIMLRNANIEFDTGVLNASSNAKNYVSENEKALNLGIYGADLAYVSSYQNTQSILEYFAVINSLSEDLQIKSDLGQNLIERFGDNMDNLDSLYVLNGEIYKAANQYLKENDRNELASLILTGGWVEALHISINSSDKEESIAERIGEQKSALNSLINLLKSNEDEKVQEVVQSLQDLKSDFDALEYVYVYKAPIHDKISKTTHLKGITSVKITPEQKVSIKEKVNNLRTLITQ